ALDLLAAGDEIDRVADRAREDERGADDGAAALERDLVAERDKHAAVADGERDELAAARPPAKDDDADREDERRVEVEDQPLEAGGDVREAGEVEEAREVVARKAEA